MVCLLFNSICTLQLILIYIYYKVSNCQTNNIDFFVPGKPSEKLISAMSYLYDRASPTKYSTKSPLVIDLLIEHELMSSQFSNTAGIASINYFWLYVILVLLILYPGFLKIALSVYNSIEVYLFKNVGTSNSILDNTVGLQDGTPETRFYTPTLQDNDFLNNEVLASSPKSSSSSSTELPYFDLTDTAGHNLTAQEMLQAHYGPTGAPPAYLSSNMQSSQSGYVFSSSIDTPEDPSENINSNVNGYDNTLDFGGLAAHFTSSSEPSNQNNDSVKVSDSSRPFSQNIDNEKTTGSSKLSNQDNNNKKSAGSSELSNQSNDNKKVANNPESFNQNNTTNKTTGIGLNSSVFSDISDFSFIPPSISLSSKFPELANNQPNNNDTYLSLSRPSSPLPGASHNFYNRNTHSKFISSGNSSSNTSSSSDIQFPKVNPKFANTTPTNIREGLDYFFSVQPGINEFVDRVKEKFERERAKAAQRRDPSSGQTSSSLRSASRGSFIKSAKSKAKFYNTSNFNVSGTPVPEVAPKYITFTSVNFREKLGRLAAQKKTIKISADQRRNTSPVQNSDSPGNSRSSPYKTFKDNYSSTSSPGKIALASKLYPIFAHAKPVYLRKELSHFSAMKRAINNFADQTKADGKKPMQKQAPSNVQKPKPTIQDDFQPSRSKTQALDSSDTLPFAGLVPSKFKTQYQNFPSTSQAADSTSFLYERQTDTISGSVEFPDSLSSSSRTRPVYTTGKLRASQSLSSSFSNNSKPRYTPGSLRSSNSSSSSSKSKAPYSPGTLRPAVNKTMPNNAANADAIQGIRGPFNVRTLADGIAECARAHATATASNRTIGKATAFVDFSASNSTSNSTIPLDAAQSLSNTSKPMESRHSNITPKDHTFASAMDVANSLDNVDYNVQFSDEISNSNDGFESVDLLVTATEPANSANLGSILLDNQLFFPTSIAYTNNNSFEQVDFATTFLGFAVNSDTVTTFNLAARDAIDDNFEQFEPATANVAFANDSASASASIATHSEDLIAFSPNDHDHTYNDIVYNIEPYNTTTNTTTAAATVDFQPGTSTSNNIGDDILKREAKKEARYASKIAAVFPFTATKEQYKIVSHSQYIPLPDSSTPVYATAYNPIAQSASSDVSNSSSGKSGSPLLFVDTDKSPSPSESGNGKERPVSDLLVCQPAGLREYDIPKGLVSLQ